MQDGEIQKEMLKETRTAKKALEVAMKTTSINNIQGSWNRSQPSTSQLVKPTICPNCGYGWSAAHRQNCPDRGKNCKNCRITNHFAKISRKPKHPFKPKPRVNNVDDSVSEAATVGTSATVGERVNDIDRLLQKHSIYDANYDSDYDDYDDNCVATISINNNTRELEPVNLHICIRNTSTKALVDSGSVCTIINKSLATTVVSDCKDSFWVQSPEMHELKIFSNDLIKTLGVIRDSIKCNDWIATGVNVKVVDVGQIIGRDLFQQLGLSLTQTKQVANVD